MKINQLKAHIPEKFVKKFKEEGVKTLYPAQAEAIEGGLLEGRSQVISTPTASGKTLIANLAIISKLCLQKESKIIYIVPLVALASEKFKYYKELFGQDYKVAVSVGDLDSVDPWLAHYQMIITTSEKLDSLIRHRANWLSQVDLIIVDEIHLLNDSSRGPTLEVLLTILKKKLPQAQFLGLSATINNADQLSQWLRADLIKSKFRPVRLYEGVCFESQIRFVAKKYLQLKKPEEAGVVFDTVVKRKKQLLYFVSTRRSSESVAEKTGGLIQKHITVSEQDELNKLSSEILHQLDRPTKQCQKLAQVIKSGIAFHHAGLLSSQKSLIEENFRKGLIKIICATPTLAIGVNLPAFRVLIRDIKRYYPGSGSVSIPVMEYKQFAGRAGRPQYDDYGEAIIMSRSSEDSQEMISKYILGKPENIESKLAQGASLRIHTLSLIAIGLCQSFESLLDFFNLSFFGFQYNDVSLIENKLKEILLKLEAWGFIEGDEEVIVATRLGKRISQLYLDPQTAYQFSQCLDQAEQLGFENLGLLQAICYTDEMQPSLRVKTKEAGILNEAINRYKEHFLMDVPLMWDNNYEHFLRSMKTALCLDAWINEASEDELFEKLQISPGELHNKLKIADWLIYCFIEIASLLRRRQFIPDLKKLRVRLSYGVSEQLLKLISLRDIGRVRSRKLFDQGIKDIQDLKTMPQARLEAILGPKIASKIRAQITKG